MYAVFFTAARTSLSIVLKDPSIKIERLLVVPPPEGEGDGREVEVEGSVCISRARLDRKVRVRVKVQGRLRVPLDVVEHGILGGGEGPDREWTISEWTAGFGLVVAGFLTGLIHGSTRQSVLVLSAYRFNNRPSGGKYLPCSNRRGGCMARKLAPLERIACDGGCSRGSKSFD